MLMTDIKTNLNKIQANIDALLNASTIQTAPKLIAVSKKQTLDTIKQAQQLGIQNFGENYAQEFEQKAQALQALSLTWHFLGPIQSNKTKIIAQHAHWVHSLDREKIADKLNQHAENFNKTLNVLIQVNIDNEPQKAGIAPENIAQFAEQISHYPQLHLRGLMIIPKNTKNTDEPFANCQQLFNTLRLEYPSIDTLSMGMSNDYITATKYGSTMIRIGSALLGERK